MTSERRTEPGRGLQKVPGGVVRATTSMDQDLYRKVRALAIKLDLPITKTIAKLVERGLAAGGVGP